jgi:hypothetical protein
LKLVGGFFIFKKVIDRQRRGESMEDLNLEKLHFLGQDVDSAVKVVRDRKVGSTITKN